MRKVVLELIFAYNFLSVRTDGDAGGVIIWKIQRID